MGIHEKHKRKPSFNPVLEDFYSQSKKQPTEIEIRSLAFECNIQIRQVEHWFRCRRNQDKPSITEKFCQSCWRFIIYLISVLTGVVLLIDKTWFWDQRECFTDYPVQPLSPSLYWYYMLQLGFSISLLMTLHIDVKRKDLKMQIVHHCATIFLIVYSYSANLLRVGMIVMLYHDVSDPLLELAKMFIYSKWQKMCNVVFTSFGLVFIFFRLFLFPTRVLYTTLYYSLGLYPPYFGYYFCNSLLMIIQILNIFWAYLILQMAYRLIFTEEVGKDIRSDMEESDNSEPEINRKSELETNRRHWDGINTCVTRNMTKNCVSNRHSVTN